MFFTKTPSLLKKFYPQLIWDIPNNFNKIYLTFDDGPTPEITDWVLDTLKQFNAKATFFCIGKNVVKNPAIYERIISENHAIGNHGYEHMNGWKTTHQEYAQNAKKCTDLISSTLFRPPYGRIKKSQIRSLGEEYKIVMWDVLSADFDAKTTLRKCLDNVIMHTKSGSIIVFHDSVKAAPRLKYALPKVLDHFIKKGYVFDSIKVN